MDQILETIGDTIGGFFANPIVQLAIQAVAIYFVILWLASAGRGRPDWSPDGSRLVYTQTSGAKLGAYNMNRLAVVAGRRRRAEGLRRETRSRRQLAEIQPRRQVDPLPGHRRSLGVPRHRCPPTAARSSASSKDPA